MKKKLESELVSIAHEILRLKGKEDVLKMHDLVSTLHEKLSVLKFVYEHFDGPDATTEHRFSFFDSLSDIFNDKETDVAEVENKPNTPLDGAPSGDIIEPVMNKIKDMVSLMPEEAQTSSLPISLEEDLESLTSGFEEMPVFEPVSSVQNTVATDKKSLNETIKGNLINIDLNDKIAFIKHLFEDRSDDYNRVISQLNTFETFDQAKDFIDKMVKPDYNDWLGKEVFESRFIARIASRFE